MISYPISLSSWPLNFCHSFLSAPTWTQSYLENELLSVSWKGCRIRLSLTCGSWVDRCCRELEGFNHIWFRSGIRSPLASITSLPLCVRMKNVLWVGAAHPENVWADLWTGYTLLSIWLAPGNSYWMTGIFLQGTQYMCCNVLTPICPVELLVLWYESLLLLLTSDMGWKKPLLYILNVCAADMIPEIAWLVCNYFYIF